YFLEMNTRLQVEHPVTELVTGFDLVREQFRVANGEPLSFTQEQVAWHGHAIECRIYAEDPENNFFPSPGRLTHLREPSGPVVVVDSVVQLNSEVSIYYDPMIAKLAVWGTTREEAIDRLARALDEYSVAGITTTLSFFRDVVRDAEFVAAKLDTGFIPRFYARQARTTSRSNTAVETDLAMIAAALQYANSQKRRPSVGSGSASRWKMSARQALVNEQTI